MKITNKLLNRIVKEERKKLLEELSRDLVGSISDYEIEKLLFSYLRKAGIPENIQKLSVLFPILEKCGLKKFVQAYVNVSEESPQEAQELLKRLKVSLVKVIKELEKGETEEVPKAGDPKNQPDAGLSMMRRLMFEKGSARRGD